MPITYIPNEDPLQKWPPFLGPVGRIPQSREEILRVFGDPRQKDEQGRPLGRPSKSWENVRIVELHGDNAIPQIPAKYYFHCHKLAEPYIREAFRRAELICPEYKIVKAASYVYRHIQRNPQKSLSLHSWGIAVDINSDDNRGIHFKKSSDIPEFFSAKWKKLWPKGMPREFVDAWLSVGFRWGGDWDGDWESKDQHFVDPMHMQLAICG